MQDDFPDFLQAASECGLPSTARDLAMARNLWKYLDRDQKAKALEGLYARRECGEFAQPEFRPLPQNYLMSRTWERPLRTKRNGNGHALPTAERMKKLAPMVCENDTEVTDLLRWAEANGHAVNNGADLVRVAKLREKP